MRAAVVESDLVQRIFDALPSFLQRQSLIDQWELDVLLCVQVADQIEALKNKADLPVSYFCQLILRVRLDRQTAEQIRALIRRIKAAHDVHERRFAAAGRTDDADKFIFVNMQTHMVERVQRLIAHAVYLGYIVKYDHVLAFTHMMTVYIPISDEG